MDWIYKKVIGFFLGEALANSDRVKVAVAAALTKALLVALAGCTACAAFLTPDVVANFSNWIAGSALALVVSITHRDVGAPGEVVPGAAAKPYVDVRAAMGDPGTK